MSVCILVYAFTSMKVKNKHYRNNLDEKIF